MASVPDELEMSQLSEEKPCDKDNYEDEVTNANETPCDPFAYGVVNSAPTARLYPPSIPLPTLQQIFQNHSENRFPTDVMSEDLMSESESSDIIFSELC